MRMRPMILLSSLSLSPASLHSTSFISAYVRPSAMRETGVFSNVGPLRRNAKKTHSIRFISWLKTTRPFRSGQWLSYEERTFYLTDSVILALSQPCPDFQLLLHDNDSLKDSHE